MKTPMHAPETHEFLAKMHPVGRMGEIKDIVDAILFLENALSSLERSCMSTVARAPVIKQRGAAARPLLFSSAPGNRRGQYGR